METTYQPPLSQSDTHTHSIIHVGQSSDHNIACPDDVALFPRTTLPALRIPDLAAMTDSERRFWVAPCCELADDELPQVPGTTDVHPLADLQPGTQQNQVASAGVGQLAAGQWPLQGVLYPSLTAAPCCFPQLHTE